MSLACIEVSSKRLGGLVKARKVAVSPAILPIETGPARDKTVCRRKRLSCVEVTFVTVSCMARFSNSAVTGQRPRSVLRLGTQDPLVQ